MSEEGWEMPVRIDRVTTRGGDGGMTSLGDGRRVKKTAARIEALGAVDEANATIGLLRCHAPKTEDCHFARIQNQLFDLGAVLAVPGGPQTFGLEPVTWLEQIAAEMNADLPALRSFVLPAGGPYAAALHFARTVVRRAERRLCALMEALAEAPAIERSAIKAPASESQEHVRLEQALRYVNRLSDLLFIYARCAALAAGGEVYWEPAAAKAKG